MPKDSSAFVQCHIKREKEGLTKGFSKIFTLYLDGQNENDQTFLLIARKHVTLGGHSEYFIGNNQLNINEENSIAKLKSINLTSTEYILYYSNQQKQSDAICYDDHIFGTKQPRKLIILLNNNQNIEQISKKNETIIDQWKSGNSTNLIILRNQTPIYNEESKSFLINLRGNRVKQPSHKNFQLIDSNEGDQNNITMQFGRIDENNFALDYRYPLTLIQAFAIALTSFHNRFNN
jgi:tubby-related protein 1